MRKDTQRAHPKFKQVTRRKDPERQQVVNFLPSAILGETNDFFIVKRSTGGLCKKPIQEEIFSVRFEFVRLS